MSFIYLFFIGDTTSTTAAPADTTTAAPAETTTVAPAETTTAATAATTTAAPTDQPSPTEGTLALFFRLDRTFTSGLTDPTSGEFQSLAAMVIQVVSDYTQRITQKNINVFYAHRW